MKRGDINLLSVGLKNKANPITGLRLEYLEVNKLVEILNKEKEVQGFLDSLSPGDILMWRDFDVIDFVWFEVKFTRIIDIERRVIEIEEINTRGTPRKLLSAYEYGSTIFTLEEYQNFVV